MLVVRLPNGKNIQLAHRWAIADWVLPKDWYVTLGRTVYVSPKTELTTIDLPILIHEYRHVEQQDKHGAFMFYLCYIFSRKFRLAAEADAYASQIEATLLTEQRIAVLSLAAKNLASWRYLWAAGSYEKALLAIKYNCSYLTFI